MFPGMPEAQYRHWADRHADMLSHEQLDSLAFRRVGCFGGPNVTLHGLTDALNLIRLGKGVILVANHWDRLLLAPVLLARQGVVVNVLTMPIHDNDELDCFAKKFLQRKIKNFLHETHGEWRTTNQSARSVINSLKNGGVWLILADAWRPEFSNMRNHSFLDGQVSLPSGVERMAKLSGSRLLLSRVMSDRSGDVSVMFDLLPEDPHDAVGACIRKLEEDVKERPWAWWQWGIFHHIWNGTEEC